MRLISGAMIIDDFTDKQGADLQMNHASETDRIDHGVFAAVFLINRSMLCRGRIYRMKYAWNINVFPFYAFINIAVAMVIIDREADYDADSPVKLSGKLFVFQ